MDADAPGAAVVVHDMAAGLETGRPVARRAGKKQGDGARALTGLDMAAPPPLRDRPSARSEPSTMDECTRIASGLPS